MSEHKITYQERIDYALQLALLTQEETAQEVVQMQAEAIREATMRVYLEFGYTEGGAEYRIDTYLREHGYIEPADTATPNIESDNPECMHERLGPGSDNAPYCRDCGEQF